MKELMDLLTRAVLALEIIARSFSSASLDVPPVRKAAQGTEVGAVRKEAGPANDRPTDRRKSDISDVFQVSPDVLERSRAAMVTFAIDNLKVPWSEAHMRAVMEYEKKVEEEFGDGSSEQLPWRRLVPRGEDAIR